MFKVLSTDENEALIIELTDDLKMENAPEFYDSFQSVLAEKHKKVVVDFRQIRFVDSSGVGMLLKCAHALQERSGELYIFGLSRSLLSVFKLAGLLKVFHLLEEPAARADYPELFDIN